MAILLRMGFWGLVLLGTMGSGRPAHALVGGRAHQDAVTSVSKTAEAPAVKKSVCRFETNDIGTIVGRGPTSEDAFEDAATQCFERRRTLYRAKNGSESDRETGELYIDVCVNLKCS